MEALRVALIFALVAVVFTAEIKEEKKKEIAPSDVKESKKGEHQEVNSVVEEEGKSEVKTEEKKTGTEVKTEVKKKEEGEKKKQVHESSVEEEEENDDINEQENEHPKKQQSGRAQVALNPETGVGRDRGNNGL